jgi:hypothetical protein
MFLAGSQAGKARDYCLYANDGMPYEGFAYYIINEQAPNPGSD